MPAHNQQQQQRRRQALDVMHPGPTTAVPAGHQPAATVKAGAAAGAGAGESAGVSGTQVSKGAGTGDGPGTYAASAGPMCDVRGVQQQLEARSQVVQAAWEEVQQLAQRLSADVFGGGLLPTPMQQEEPARQPSTEHRS
jgi:hypothetical protein